jgi:hypothetical protein
MRARVLSRVAQGQDPHPPGRPGSSEPRAHRQLITAEEHAMSLNHRQQHQLYRIESRLRRSEPHLAAMLTVFDRLAAGEGRPAWEQVSCRRDRIGQATTQITQAIAVLAATVIVLISAVLALMTAPFSDRRCRPPAPKTESAARSRETGQNPAEWA